MLKTLTLLVAITFLSCNFKEKELVWFCKGHYCFASRLLAASGDSKTTDVALYIKSSSGKALNLTDSIEGLNHNEFIFNFSQHVFLIHGNDTIPSSFSHFEQSGNIKFEKIQFVSFDTVITTGKKDSLRLLFDDQFLTNQNILLNL